MRLLKRWAKWIAIVIVVVGIAALAGGYLQSPDFSVSRSAVVDAPPDEVYALVASPRNWTRWSVWNRRDPATTIAYSGPDSGVGAAWTWHGKSQGDGKMTLTAAEPASRVAFDLYFADFGTTSRGALRFAPESSATRITWTINASMGSNPLYHWFALGADGKIGPDFSAWLANLKALAEKG